jgi:hypothetical protein
MASSIIGQLRVILGIDATDVGRGANDAEKRMAKLTKNMEQVGQRISKVGAGLSVALTLPFAALIKSAIPAAKESAQAIGQVEAALKSMGAAAGRNSVQLQAQAKSLMRLSTFDDDEILRKVTANLLTFGNVAKEQFDRAQLAAVDLSTRMSGDLQASTLLVGKALNDPVKGMAALRRVGIQLTEQQKTQIEGFVKTNQMAKAQGIILTELERQFGGSAKAMRDATPGMDLKNAWDDFNETVGAMALKILPPLTSGLAKVLGSFNAMEPSMQRMALIGAAIAAALGPVLTVIGKVVELAAPLVVRLGATGLTGIMGPLAIAVLAVYTAWKEWDRIGPYIDGVVKRTTEAYGKIDAFLQKVREFGDENLFGKPDSKDDVFTFIDKNVAESMTRIDDFLAGIQKWAADTDAAMLRGWQSFDQGWQKFTASVHRWGGEAATAATDAMRRMVEGIRTWVVDRLNAIWEPVRTKLETVKGWFYQLYDAVVGHSYVPDMVDEIGQHMARLDKEMVQPTKKATDKVAAAYEALRDRVRPILARLFPDQERSLRFAKEQADLLALAEKEKWSDDAKETALNALDRDRSDEAFGKRDSPDFVGADVLDRDGPKLVPATISDQSKDTLRQTFRDTFSDGMRAALHGDFKGFFKSWLADTAADGLESALNKVSDVLADLLGSIFDKTSSGGGGGILGAIGKLSGLFGGGGSGGFSSFGQVLSNNAGFSMPQTKLPGFATGGSFKIGGNPGIDKNLVQFWGSKDEIVDIRKPGNDGGPSGGGNSFHFDLTGAVVTQDLLNQMNAIGANAASGGAAGGVQAIGYRQSRSLARG